ncbi:MAG: M23 family metallopeptidase [Candidatus Cloacimonetes bacterium]|nr:M23 family metallopeptidase [Candidatus Cloacimonadota bacterium]
MNKLLLFLLFLFLIITFLLYLENRNLHFKIDQQSQEIKASGKYIEKLTAELQKPSFEEPLFSKEDKLTELLDSYIKEQQSKTDPDPNQQQPETKVELSNFQINQLFYPDLVPIKGNFPISQRYSQKHQGIDFAAPLGTEVISTAAGIVTSVYEDKYFGLVIEIDHLNGFKSRYAHLAKVLLSTKDFLKKGEAIGLVGDTGNSTAAHLHFEICENGEKMNPEKFIKF